jgi:uncharacterized membrane protein
MFEQKRVDKRKGKSDSHLRKYLITGILTAIPIWVTWLLIKFILNLFIDMGDPIIKGIAEGVRPFSEKAADLLRNSTIQTFLAILFTLGLIYFLGWLANRVLGRRFLSAFDRLVERIPFIKVVYGGVKNIIEAFQKKPTGIQRVVLIDFPSQRMKCVGLVTRTIVDEDTGRLLAAVFVPTTPNPTSGYLEIVPVENITSTDWTVDEAMTFIVSGGTVSPGKMNYDKSSGLPPE